MKMWKMRFFIEGEDYPRYAIVVAPDASAAETLARNSYNIRSIMWVKPYNAA